MNSSMWYAVQTYSMSLHLSVSFPNFSTKELSTTRANFRSLYFRSLSIRRKILVWICGNYQRQVEQHSSEFSEKRTTSRGTLRFLEISLPFWFSFRNFQNFRSNSSLFGNETISRFSGNFPTKLPYHLSPFGIFRNFCLNREHLYFVQTSQPIKHVQGCGIFLLVCQTFQPIKRVQRFELFLLVFQTSQPIKHVQCFDLFLLVFQTSQWIKRVQPFNILLLVFHTFQLVLEPKTKRVEINK